tara:strand:- start:476 stop:724 length:249 start_codon:yes stop_codon:yes gene_type:complete
MIHLSMDLGDNTELNVSFELYPGNSGSYDEPPSLDLVSIETVEICQLNGKEYHTVRLSGIDDTLFPVDYGMIENMIQKHIEQ